MCFFIFVKTRYNPICCKAVGNNINRIALAIITVALLLSILWPYEAKLIDWSKTPTYLVLESDEIYFNNTRIVRYRTDESLELTQQGFKTHRSTNALSDTSIPFMNFVIINNWRNDQAYIVAEPSNRRFFRDSVVIIAGAKTFNIDLDHMDFEEHYKLAASLFESSLEFTRPFMIHGGDSLMLYGTQGNEKTNTIVLKDYFRLICRFQ